MKLHNTIFLLISKIEKLFYLFLLLYSLNLKIYGEGIKCNDECFQSTTQAISSINPQKSLVVLFEGENKKIFSEYDENQLFKSFLLKDILENITIFQSIQTYNNINIYENIERILRKNGFQIKNNNKITLDRVLSNSINITHYPISLDLDSVTLFKELKKRSTLSSDFDRPEFNSSESNYLLKKYILYKIIDNKFKDLLNYNEIKFSLNQSSNKIFYTINLNAISFFLENIQINPSLNRIFYDKLSEKNFSISEYFPATGYGFAEYNYNNIDGFITIYNDSQLSELIFVVPEYEILFFISTKKNTNLNLLKYTNLFINHIKENIELNISDELNDYSDFSGEYLPTSSPKTGPIYLYNIMKSIKIESTEKGLFLKGLDSSDIFFESKNQLEFACKDIPSVRILFATDNFGNVNGFDLALGNLQSYEKINFNQNYDIFSSLIKILFYFFSVFIINLLNFYNSLTLFQKFPPKIRQIKNLILIGCVLIISYILSIIIIVSTFNVNSEIFSLTSFYVSLIPIFSSIFFSYFSFILIGSILSKELNFFRIIKYLIFMGMVIYFYFILFYFEMILISL